MAIGRNLVEVGISMVLHDRFSQTAGVLSNNYRSLFRDMRDYNQALSQGTGMVFDYGTNALKATYGAYEHAANIGKQIFLTSKIAGATAAEGEALNQLTMEVNRRTPLTNMDIASGMRFLAMAGNSAEAIQEMTEPAAQLASVFDMAMGGKGGTADLLTNIMKTFGIASSETRSTADMLAKATTSANISLQDLAQSVYYSGAAARNAGIDVKSLSAAIGVLGNNGIQASMAGTSLANMVRQFTLALTGQRKRGYEMLQSMGLSREDFQDAEGNLIRLDKIIQKIAERAKSMGTIDTISMMYNLFGARGERASSALLRDFLSEDSEFAKIMNKLDSSEGFLGNLTQEYLTTNKGIIDQLNASIDNLKKSFGEAASGPVGTVIKLITKGIEGLASLLSSNSVGSFIVQIGIIGVTIGTIVAGVKLITRSLAVLKGLSQIFSTNLRGASGGAMTLNGNLVTVEGTILRMNREMQLFNTLAARAGFIGTRGMMSKGGWVGFPINVNGQSHTIWQSRKNGQVSLRDSKGRFVSMSTLTGTNKASTATSGSLLRRGGSSIVSGVSRAGTGLMSLFGGPWGLALTGIAIGLPLLVDALSANTRAQQEQNERMKALQNMTYQQASQYYRDTWYKGFLQTIGAGIGNARGSNKPIKVVLEQDGVTTTPSSSSSTTSNFLFGPGN